MSQRLDQFIAHATGAPRKAVKAWIKSKRVSIDGKICNDHGYKCKAEQLICLDNEVISQKPHLYLALNKPQNYCCSHEDDGSPSALKLLSESLQNYPKKLLFAGRLDADTTGLVLLSSDGQWCHKVTHPSKSQLMDQQGQVNTTNLHSKTYCVSLAHAIDNEAITALEQGVMLHNEDKPTLPCQIQIVDEQTIQLSLVEGRYHQVKRMLAAVGNRVIALHRESIAGINVDNLAEGEYRELTPDEVATFQHKR